MYKRFVISLVGALVLVLAFEAGLHSQGVPSYGRVTGNDFQQYPELSKITYVVGVADGFALFAYAYREGGLQQLGSKISSATECLFQRKIPNGQLYDVVKKWIQDHPERLDWKMSLVVHDSILQISP